MYLKLIEENPKEILSYYEKPFYVYVSLSNMCNANCVFCDVRTNEEKKCSIDVFKLIDELSVLGASIDEIKEVIGMDYRKSLAFLCGFGLNEDNIFSSGLDSCVRSLMVKPELINDSFIRRKIWNMIAKRIQMCKRGAIRINANFAIITGDPYAFSNNTLP